MITVGNKVTMGYYLSSDSVIDSPQHMEGTNTEGMDISRRKMLLPGDNGVMTSLLGPGTIPHSREEQERRQSCNKA